MRGCGELFYERGERCNEGGDFAAGRDVGGVVAAEGENSVGSVEAADVFVVHGGNLVVCCCSCFACRLFISAWIN